MSKPKMVIVFVLILMFTAILVQNTEVVTVHLLWWDVEMSMFTVPIIAIISIVIGYVLSRITENRRNKKEEV